MILKEYIADARKTIPWRYDYMVEQDIIISKFLVSIYQNPLIKNSLAFRGGTALNKLFLNPPARFSEDLDFVQLKKEPIGPTIDAVRDSMKWFFKKNKKPKVKLGRRGTKMLFAFFNIDGDKKHVKVEINTTEHFHAESLKEVKFKCNSKYFSGQADVVSYSIDELMATKIRALYQRKKGRDLFDIWYVFKNGLADTERTIAILSKYNDYNEEKITSNLFEKNMLEKRESSAFRSDIQQLLPLNFNYSFDAAFEFVMKEIAPYLR